jgi:hypothetical protein
MKQEPIEFVDLGFAIYMSNDQSTYIMLHYDENCEWVLSNHKSWVWAKQFKHDQISKYLLEIEHISSKSEKVLTLEKRLKQLQIDNAKRPNNSTNLSQSRSAESGKFLPLDIKSLVEDQINESIENSSESNENEDEETKKNNTKAVKK